MGFTCRLAEESAVEIRATTVRCAGRSQKNNYTISAQKNRKHRGSIEIEIQINNRTVKLLSEMLREEFKDSASKIWRNGGTLTWHRGDGRRENAIPQLRWAKNKRTGSKLAEKP